MPGYSTKQVRIAVAGTADLEVRSLVDREQFSDPMGEAERLGISSAAWPMFGLTWPSGIRLAAHMAQRPVTAGERILEIGCGLALASLVCQRRGADITASDCHPLAELFLIENLRLNHLLPLPYRHGHWGAPMPMPHAGDAIRIPLVDRYDLVIGSDLLYERDAHGALATFIGRHTRDSATVWIVDPDRGNRPAFSRNMASEGFALREERLDTLGTMQSPAYKGRLMRFRRGRDSDTMPCGASDRDLQAAI
jgi:predicted nicotinamide N-methyase